jgi:hypothetical protein
MSLKYSSLYARKGATSGSMSDVPGGLAHSLMASASSLSFRLRSGSPPSTNACCVACASAYACVRVSGASKPRISCPDSSLASSLCSSLTDPVTLASAPESVPSVAASADTMVATGSRSQKDLPGLDSTFSARARPAPRALCDSRARHVAIAFRDPRATTRKTSTREWRLSLTKTQIGIFKKWRLLREKPTLRPIPTRTSSPSAFDTASLLAATRVPDAFRTRRVAFETRRGHVLDSRTRHARLLRAHPLSP